MTAGYDEYDVDRDALIRAAVHFARIIQAEFLPVLRKGNSMRSVLRFRINWPTLGAAWRRINAG